jgi:hypothetical protein
MIDNDLIDALERQLPHPEPLRSDTTMPSMRDLADTGAVGGFMTEQRPSRVRRMSMAPGAPARAAASPEDARWQAAIMDQLRDLSASVAALREHRVSKSAAAASQFSTVTPSM